MQDCIAGPAAGAVGVEDVAMDMAMDVERARVGADRARVKELVEREGRNALNMYVEVQVSILSMKNTVLTYGSIQFKASYETLREDLLPFTQALACTCAERWAWARACSAS